MAKTRHSANRILLKNKIVPALLAAVAISILTFVLYYFNFDVLYGKGASAVLFASFGSSAFILFMMPRSHSAKIARFVKSYTIAAIAGILGFYLLDLMPLYVVAGIVVFALSITMYAVDAAHAPAVGIALAFVLYRMGTDGVIIVILGVAILLFLRLVLERFVYIVENDVVKEVERFEIRR